MAGVRLRGAIFDVDGVLVDSPHERAWRESLDQLMQGEWADVAPQTRWHPGALTSALYAEHVAGSPARTAPGRPSRPSASRTATGCSATPRPSRRWSRR